MSINKQNNLEKIKSQKFLIIAFVTITILFAFRGSLDDKEFSWISISSYVVIPGIMMILAIVLAIKVRKIGDYHSKALIMFAMGVTFWFVAEQIWTVYDDVFGIDPYPSLADFFYLGAYPFFIAFFIFYLRPLKKVITKNIKILAVTLSVMFLIPSFLTTFDLSMEDNLFEIVIALSYPVADTLLLIPAIIGFFFLFKGERNYFWSLILVGFISIIIADTFFLFLTIDDTYFDGHPVDLFWLYGYILFIFAIYHNKKQITQQVLHPNSLVRNNVIESIQFDTITKLIVPLTLLIVILITTISLVQLFFYQQPAAELYDTLVFITIGIIGIIAAFSIIIIILNKNLNRFVNMKTKELQKKQNDVNKQLNQLKQLDEEKSEFLSMITHELKTPIVPIKSYTDLLLANTSNLDGEQIKKLNVIQSSTTVLLQMMSDLLDVQKIELRQLTLKKEKQNMVDLINETIEKNQPTMKENKITFEKDLNDVYCKCDKVRIEQVLNNLISNAIKFTKSHVSIKLNSHAGVATIMIKDNGIGLEENKLEEIFKKFYQVDVTLTREHQGSGLGLSICKGIIDAHNGKIWVESKGKNMGSEFYFQLPID